MSTKCDEWYQQEHEGCGETVEPGTKRKRKSNSRYYNNNSDDEGNNNKIPAKHGCTKSNNNVAAAPAPPSLYDATTASTSPTEPHTTLTDITTHTLSLSFTPDEKAGHDNAAVEKDKCRGDIAAAKAKKLTSRTDQKMWPSLSNIADNCHASISPDGSSIQCLHCHGKGRSKGIIKIRHPYCMGA
eukprot:7833137-Ditylum_brightwellii.AAC.1